MPIPGNSNTRRLVAEQREGSAVLQEAVNLLREMIYLTMRKMEQESADASLADHARILSSVSTAVGRLAYLVDIQARQGGSGDAFSTAVDQALAEINAAMDAEIRVEASPACDQVGISAMNFSVD